MRSRVHMKPKPIGRRYSEDSEGSNGLKISFPAVVKIYLQAGGGGGGTFDGFYATTGDNGANGARGTFTIFTNANPTYDVAASSSFGAVPAGSDPGDDGDAGEATTFEGESVAGGAGGLAGASGTTHTQTPSAANPYFTDAGVVAWPVGKTSAAVSDASTTGQGGWGVDSSHGDVGGADAAWRSANARGKKGRIDMVIEG